jgi:hypothetical protein
MPIVYKLRNTITEKVYIGWTGTSLENRWASHIKTANRNKDNRKFYNAIRKYGDLIWEKEVLVEVDTNNEAKQREIEYIALYDSYNNGYNATKGGDGNNGIIMSEASNAARSKALKGVPKSPETIQKFKQRVATPEENHKRSIAHTGMKKPWVKWTKEQIQQRAITRRTLSLEQYNYIHLLKSQGLSGREISSETGISYDIVKKWLKKEWLL